MSLIIWVLCGVISIFGAQTYAELGCMIPKAGGDYEYILAAFGGLWGFLFVWAQLIIIIPTANAVAALTFADYMLQPIFSTCDPPNTARIMLAASAVCKRFIFIVFFVFDYLILYSKHEKKVILTILNCVSVKWVTRVDTLFSAGKITALLIIIVVGIYCLIIGLCFITLVGANLY